MLIEGAFLKIPEVLNFYEDEHYLYEASISHLFSNSLILKLNARNIDNPLSKIFFEKRYDPTINQRCDVYTNFDFLNTNLVNYGYFQENYIEVKYFGNIDRRQGTIAKSKNAGSVIHDFYRLVNGTKAIGQKGLYSLIIFDDHPRKYLAFARGDGVQRAWVEKILTPGVHQIRFDLTKEPATIKQLFTTEQSDLLMDLDIRVLTFNPLEEKPGYYGALIQILKIYP